MIDTGRRPKIKKVKDILIYNITHEGHCNCECDCFVCPVSCDQIYKEYKSSFRSFESIENYKKRQLKYYNKVKDTAIEKYSELFGEDDLKERLMEELL